jgi:hypothetical protein
MEDRHDLTPERALEEARETHGLSISGMKGL